MSLEEAIGYVASDELIEVYPFLVLRTHLVHSFSPSSEKMKEELYHVFLCIIGSCANFALAMQVTPNAIRLRKRYLDVNKRKTMSKRPKD